MTEGNDSMAAGNMAATTNTDSMAVTQKDNSMAATQNTDSIIVFGADHGGFELKGVLIEHAKKLGYRVIDAGIFSPESADYPDCGEKACHYMLAGRADKAVLICGTGIGISIAANKMPGVRCALCSDATSARLTREHNDTNALALGGRIVGAELAKDIMQTWLSTDFLGSYHMRRVNKIMALEHFDMDKPVEGEYREC